MRNLHPRVDWQTGDVLTAEHLVAQDRYFESLIRFRTASQPWPFWGLSSLDIDRTKLEAGELSLTHASGIFPDGLAFDIPASDAGPEPVTLTRYVQSESGELDVFLAIPNEAEPADSEDTDGLEFDERSRNRRFLSSPLTSDGSVPLLQKNFRILITDSAPAIAAKSYRGSPVLGEGAEKPTRRKPPVVPRGYSCLQLARIEYSQSTFRTDETFVPPILDISASTRVGTEIAANLLEAMKQKSAELASGFSPFRSIEHSTMNAVEIGRLSYLLVLNDHLPVLRSLCQVMDYTTGTVRTGGHPYELFRQLVSLAASLLAFAPFMRITDLPHYDHSDLQWTFGSLNDTLLRLLNLELLGNSLSFRLKPIPGMTRFAQTEPIDPRYFSNTTIFIAAYGRDKNGSVTSNPDTLRGLDFSWVPGGSVSQFAFANPIQAGSREEPTCLRRRNYSYHPVPRPRESDLTTEMRFQAKWSESWKEIDLELIFVFPSHERMINRSAETSR